MVRHAQALYGELTVDFNEQNETARRFYEACGFVVEVECYPKADPGVMEVPEAP